MKQTLRKRTERWQFVLVPMAGNAAKYIKILLPTDRCRARVVTEKIQPMPEAIDQFFTELNEQQGFDAYYAIPPVAINQMPSDDHKRGYREAAQWEHQKNADVWEFAYDMNHFWE